MYRREVRPWLLTWGVVFGACAVLGACAGEGSVPLARSSEQRATGAPASGVSSEGGPTFARDIAPLVQQHCEGCHRPGGAGPMPLTTYEQLRAWGPAVRQQVVSRGMPPFHAAGPIGYWRDDPRLGDAEIESFARWVDEGYERGDPAVLPEPRVWPGDGWQLGPPDQVVRSPLYRPDNASVDDYALIFLDHRLDQDLYLQGIELRTRAPQALHHANLVMVAPRHRPRGVTVLSGYDNYADIPSLRPFTWLPGERPRLREKGTAIHLWGQVELALEVHYAPTSKSIADEIELGFHYAEGMVTHRNSGVLLNLPHAIRIPPHDAHFEIRNEYTFDTDVVVKGFDLHMHLRGKSNRLIFHYPNGRSDTVFEVPDYDFDWQREYLLAEPIRVPRGTVAEAIGVFDNSAANPDNPDPNATVKNGLLSSQEMWINGIRWRDPAEAFEPFMVRSGRRVQQ